MISLDASSKSFTSSSQPLIACGLFARDERVDNHACGGALLEDSENNYNESTPFNSPHAEHKYFGLRLV